MGGPLRILQMGNLQLHRLPRPFLDLPEPHHAAFVHAREQSALRGFDAAIEQEADLVLITGRLADVEDEPRLAWMLSTQFRRLREAGIAVVLAGDDLSSFPSWARSGTQVLTLQPGMSLDVPIPRKQPAERAGIVPLKGTVHLHWGAGTSPKLMDPDEDANVRVEIHADQDGFWTEICSARCWESARSRCLSPQNDEFDTATKSGATLFECTPGRSPHSRRIRTAAVEWARMEINVPSELNFAAETFADWLSREVRAQVQRITGDATPDVVLVRCVLSAQDVAALPKALRDRSSFAHVQAAINQQWQAEGIPAWIHQLSLQQSELSEANESQQPDGESEAGRVLLSAIRDLTVADLQSEQDESGCTWRDAPHSTVKIPHARLFREVKRFLAHERAAQHERRS